MVMYQILCRWRKGGAPRVGLDPRERGTFMSRTATITSLPEAFGMIKELRADGLEWGEGTRPAGRKAVAEILEGRMAEASKADS